MCDLTRRECLIQLSRSLSLSGAALVAQLPPQFSTPATPPCDPSTKLTPARAAKGFRPGAPFNTMILAEGQAGVPVTIEGAVIGIRCGLITDAVVDFWIGDARGRQRTNAAGRYRATMLVPKPSAGRPAPRVNLRVDVPPQAERRQKTTLTTYLFLPDEVAHAENAKAAGFDPLLRMKLVKQSSDAIQASFDVILDL